MWRVWRSVASVASVAKCGGVRRSVASVAECGAFDGVWRSVAECSECDMQVVSRGAFSKTMPLEYNDMTKISVLDDTEPFGYARSRSYP